MRYVIVSDTHGRSKGLKQVIEKVGHVDGLIHLGDIGAGELQLLNKQEYPYYLVRGNNDFMSDAPLDRIVDLGGAMAFITHGHRQKVYYGIEPLVELGKSGKVDAVLFGHLHVPMIEQRDGIWIINPGSLSLPRQNGGQPTYVTLEVDRFHKMHWKLSTLK